MKGIKKIKKEVAYEFHKWREQLIVADKAIYIIVVILLGVFRPDFLMIAVYFMLYPYFFLTQRKLAFKHLFVASAVAIIWMLIANNQYGYNIKMVSLLGIHLFPLFAWAIGLFGGYIMYSHWEHVLKDQSRLKKMLLFLAFYWPILIVVETLAYHVFIIRNIAASAYVGLPLCDCIHAPRWMQFSYLALGPIYFGICEFIGLENPHYIKKK